jgi:cell division septation protein DedD
VKKLFNALSSIVIVAILVIGDPLHVYREQKVLYAQDKKQTIVQQPKSKEDQIRELQIKNENLQVEADFHELQSQQKDAQAAINKLSDDMKTALAPYNQKLLDDMTIAKKDQNIPVDYTYNVGTHGWDKPVPVKAPDGSPAKPANNTPISAPVVQPTSTPNPDKKPETKK